MLPRLQGIAREIGIRLLDRVSNDPAANGASSLEYGDQALGEDGVMRHSPGWRVLLTDLNLKYGRTAQERQLAYLMAWFAFKPKAGENADELMARWELVKMMQGIKPIYR